MSADSCADYSFVDFSNCTKATEPSACSGNRFVGGLVEQKGVESQVVGENDDRLDDSDRVGLLVDEAFCKGLDKGRSEVMIAYREKVDQATVALKTAIEEFRHLREQDVVRMETETVRLALAIAKKIIGTEASQGTIITNVVQKAMQEVADPRFPTLRLNPKDIETIRKFKDGGLAGNEMTTALQLQEDAAILQGGCIIETKLGEVDARIDQQIKIVEERLIAQLPKRTF